MQHEVGFTMTYDKILDATAVLTFKYLIQITKKFVYMQPKRNES